MKILMVCLGNICRSPIAEGVLQHKARQVGLDWIVQSAGTNGLYNGEAPHVLSQKVSKSNGIDISSQQSRQFVQDDFVQFDRIYAMANDVLLQIKAIGNSSFDQKKTSLFLDELFPGEKRDVPDPWYGNEDGYHEVYELINKTCDAIINNYLKNERKK